MTAVEHPVASSVDWECWGTYVHVAVDQPDRLQHARVLTESVLGEIDRACSRFRPDSDLTRVNRRPGEWVDVDPLLAAATSVGRLAAALTDGLVSPVLGRALVSLGYDADLAVVRGRRRPVRTYVPPPAPDAWRDLRVGESAVWLPPGCELDLGATAKAWAADVVAATLVERLGCRVLVSLGGDLRVGGAAGRPWPVWVSEARHDPVGELVEVRGGGMATSTTRLRRWGQDDELHHLLDPRTNRPVTGPVRTATASGASSLMANIASTAALVLGADALAWLEDHEVSARLVLVDGSVVTTSTWPATSTA